MSLALLLGAARAAAGAVSETRCGWIDNPTPGNWWLIDPDAEWIIARQGDPDAAGLDRMPDLTAGEFKSAQGSGYGYACACVKGAFDRSASRVTRIDFVRQLRLRQCLADRKLPAPPR